jgi:hypothetical protein
MIFFLGGMRVLPGTAPVSLFGLLPEKERVGGSFNDLFFLL